MERSAREAPWIEEEEKKNTFQKVEGEALEATLPLVTVQTLHAAAGGVAEVTAERLGNLPLEGRKGWAEN